MWHLHLIRYSRWIIFSHLKFRYCFLCQNLHRVNFYSLEVIKVIETGIILLIMDINKEFLCVLKKGPWSSRQQFRFNESFSKMITIFSVVPKSRIFAYFTKYSPATWCIKNIISVSIALGGHHWEIFGGIFSGTQDNPKKDSSHAISSLAQWTHLHMHVI